MENKNTTLGVVLGLILLLGVGYYIYTDLNRGVSDTDKNSLVSSTTPVSLDESLKDGGVTIVEIPLPDNSPLVPSLDSEVLYSDTLSREVIQILGDKIEENRSLLRADSDLPDTWILLGTQYKIAEDFDKTIEAWEYAGVISPSNSVSFHNLGDLYGYYLRDVVKGEENFLKAISNSPNDIYLYFKTADFYKDVVKDEVKRRGIVEQGLLANPDSPDLQNLLNSL